MDVRHNTALLEQAIALVVQRASIPFRRAEAEAAEKLAQASARRRLATGAAIAIAAVGIGLGVFLGFWKPRGEPQRVATSLIVPPTVPARPQGNPSGGLPDKPPVFNYEKFGNQETDYRGRHWQIYAGHHYKTDTDKEWTNAWCYTQQVIDGVNVKIDLVERESPTSLPRAPIASPESLARVGLNDPSALDLAAKCPWLDGKVYSRSEFYVSPGRTPPSSPSIVPLVPDYAPAAGTNPAPPRYVAKDGLDLLGNDFPNMPQNTDTQSECETRCNATNECVAYVFNKPFKKCFLKNAVSTLYEDEFAYTAYKDLGGEAPRISPLKLHKNAGFSGNFYKTIDNIKYMECEVECDKDQNCSAFDFYYGNKRCTMLRSVTSTNPIPMPTVSSGVKEFERVDRNEPTETQPVPTTQARREVIPLVAERGTFVVPVLINGAITLNFTVDSGASTVYIPSDVVSTLIRSKTISVDKDFTGAANFTLADGTVVPSKTFRIRSLKVGSNVIEDVIGGIGPAKGSLLLGQSFLNRFKAWSIDNQREVLILDIAATP
jgi:predicted aspartyl protease